MKSKSAFRSVLVSWFCCFAVTAAWAQQMRVALRPDPRIRVVPYRADTVYRLRGYVGYQIDITFAPGERFLGLGVGDAKGVSFAPEANHLFLKPRASHVATNLTVLTDRRTYLFLLRGGRRAAGSGRRRCHLCPAIRVSGAPHARRITRAATGCRGSCCGAERSAAQLRLLVLRQPLFAAGRGLGRRHPDHLGLR